MRLSSCLARRFFVALVFNTVAGISAANTPPLPAPAPTALARAGTTMVYDIEHETYGRIGEHRIAFRRDGDDLVVEVEDTIAVKVLMFTAFRFDARRRERWRGGRLIAYDSTTHDGGKDFSVRARAKGGALVIDGPGGRFTAPAGIFPSHPWNPAILEQHQVMDAKTGQLLSLRARAVGREEVLAHGRRVMATHYVVEGDQRRELWFDDQGNWLRLRFREDTARITFALR